MEKIKFHDGSSVEISKQFALVCLQALVLLKNKTLKEIEEYCRTNIGSNTIIVGSANMIESSQLLDKIKNCMLCCSEVLDRKVNSE